MWRILAYNVFDHKGTLVKNMDTVGVSALTTALFALLVSYATADETIYLWQNEKGNLVNSDRPPPVGIEYEVISTDSSMVRKVDANQGAVPHTSKPTPIDDFGPVDTAALKAEKNALFCEQARANLEQMETHARIRMRNARGELRYLSEKQKAAEQEKTLAVIKAHC